MKARYLLASLMVSLFALSGCDQSTMMSEKGFRLPDGDAEAGRDTFLAMQCHECHTLSGVQLPELPGQEPPYVELGGQVTKVKTYGELVTAIINPSHKLARGYAAVIVADDGESKMRVYNDVMTVKQLNDLVMYLQPHYDVVIPEFRYEVYP